MATITYRALDANGDPLFGNGQGNFLSDLDAVTQAIYTRLRLLKGEWWEDLTIGLPLFQSMLGASASKRQRAAVSLLIKAQIAGTAHVLSVDETLTEHDPATRASSYTYSATTPFGTVTVTYAAPGASVAVLDS